MIAVLKAPALCARCGQELSPGQRARVYGERVYGEGCHRVPLDGNLWEESLKVARCFRHRVEPEDRDDLVQDIVLRVAELARRRVLSQASLWVIARYTVFRYWADRARHARVMFQEREPESEDSPRLIETIPAKDVDLDAPLDLKEWLKGCPPGIIRLARKKLLGERLTKNELTYWGRYRKHRGEGPARPKRLLDPFAEAIKEMMGKGWKPRRMLEELRDLGYRGTLSCLHTYLQRLKGAVPCPWCGRLFTPSKAHIRYCSSECQRRRVRRAHADYINRRYHEDPAFRARMQERGRRQRARKRSPTEGTT